MGQWVHVRLLYFTQMMYIYIYTYIAMKISYTYLRPGKCFLACAHNVVRQVHCGAKEPRTLLKIWGISQYQDYPPYHFIILYTGSSPKIIKSRKRMKAYDLKRGRDLQPFLTTVTSCIQGPTHSWTFVRKRLQAMSLFGPSALTTQPNIRVLQWIITTTWSWSLE